MLQCSINRNMTRNIRFEPSLKGADHAEYFQVKQEGLASRNRDGGK